MGQIPVNKFDFSIMGVRMSSDLKVYMKMPVEYRIVFFFARGKNCAAGPGQAVPALQPAKGARTWQSRPSPINSPAIGPDVLGHTFK